MTKITDIESTYEIEKELLEAIDLGCYRLPNVDDLEQAMRFKELQPYIDLRWIAIAKTDIEKGFMALRRALNGGKTSDKS